MIYPVSRMPAQPDEELLRSDLDAARNALDAARAVLNRGSAEEVQLYQVARQRYVEALRRFSALVIDHPPRYKRTDHV
jgi:hypothetical protein